MTMTNYDKFNRVNHKKEQLLFQQSCFKQIIQMAFIFRN